MRRQEGPSVALGAAAVVAIAAVFVGGRMAYGLLQQTPAEPEACCKAPVEVVDEDGPRLGCVTDTVLSRCRMVQAGDRVTLVGGRCQIERDGMVARMRVLSGLKLDLNTVTEDDLQAIDAIGAGLAQRIVERRTIDGPFQRIDQLTDVHGIGAATLVELQRHLEVRSPKGVGD